MTAFQLRQQAKDLCRLSDYCRMAGQRKQAKGLRRKAAILRREAQAV